MTDSSADEYTLAVASLKSFVGPSRLPFFLHESAKKSALRALTAVGTSDYPEAGFHAAQAVEHLAKALLCDLNSEFLASRDHPQSNDFLSGKGHPDTDSLADIRTITFPDAVRRAYEKTGCGHPNQRDLDLAKLARDAAAHIGYGDADPSIAAVAAMVRLLQPLLHTQGQALASWLDDPRIVALIDAIRDLPRQDVRLSASFRKSSVLARIWNAQRELMNDYVSACRRNNGGRCPLNPKISQTTERLQQESQAEMITALGTS